ncbi:MAG: hypothetical protein H0U65_11850 [Rubrobacter sp.]|nr:hypothetical protein [Rubrobacter sp.]
MIDIGVITGSGAYEMPVESEPHIVKTRFGEVEVSVFELGGWMVGGIARHGKGHRHLPHTITHRANLAALEELGARAVLATTSVGAVDAVPGRIVIFDDLYFPENRLPNGEPCTIFTEAGEPGRGASHSRRAVLAEAPKEDEARRRPPRRRGGGRRRIRPHERPEVRDGFGDTRLEKPRGIRGEPDVRPRGGSFRGTRHVVRARGVPGELRDRDLRPGAEGGTRPPPRPLLRGSAESPYENRRASRSRRPRLRPRLRVPGRGRCGMISSSGEDFDAFCLRENAPLLCRSAS